MKAGANTGNLQNQDEILAETITHNLILERYIMRLYERLFGFCSYPFDVSFNNLESAFRAYSKLHGAYV